MTNKSEVQVDTVVIRRYVVQQRTLEYWYDIKPTWEEYKHAKEHLDECQFHLPKQDMRLIERTIIERAL